MGKFARDLDVDLANKVKNLANEMGLKAMGVNIEPIRLKKSKKDFGLVLKSSDLVALFTGDETLVAVALYEDLFNKVDEQTQEIWIRTLLSQIFYDDEKDKIIINKPELQVPLSMYHQFKDVAVQKLELAHLTIQQMVEEEKAMKAAKKGK